MANALVRQGRLIGQRRLSHYRLVTHAHWAITAPMAIGGETPARLGAAGRGDGRLHCR
jgi:hypothetical protein